MERRNFVQSALVLPFINNLDKSSPQNTERPKKGIKVSAGEDRFQKRLKIGSVILDCKVSSKDTEGDLYIFESINNLPNEGPPLHLHPNLDETFHILAGELKFKVGDDLFYLKSGDTLFVPRNVPHAFTSNSKIPCRMLIVVQSAGSLEAFFEDLSKIETITPEIGAQLYNKHTMVLLGPPIQAD